MLIACLNMLNDSMTHHLSITYNRNLLGYLLVLINSINIEQDYAWTYTVSFYHWSTV